MAADTYDDVLGLLLQGTGNNNNSWGSNANDFVFKLVARAIAGYVAHTDTGGALNLATTTPPAGASSALDMMHDFTGTLTSDLTVTVPSVSKLWVMRNATGGAYYLYVKTSGGTAVQVPQGTTKILYCDGTDVFRLDEAEIGDLVLTGKASADSGTVACDGTSYLKTALPDLYAKIGTTWGSADSLHFNVPDFITNNLFLRAAGGSVAVATLQSSQNKAHTHDISGVPEVGTLTAASDGAHTHTATSTDSGHTHNYTYHQIASSSNPDSGWYTMGPGGSTATSSGSANISTTVNSGGAHTHNVTGTLTAGTLAVDSDGGTEARPNAAAVIIAIKY